MSCSRQDLAGFDREWRDFVSARATVGWYVGPSETETVLASIREHHAYAMFIGNLIRETPKPDGQWYLYQFLFPNLPEECLAGEERTWEIDGIFTANPAQWQRDMEFRDVTPVLDEMPTQHWPGSDGKIDVMGRRFTLKFSLHHPQDADLRDKRNDDKLAYPAAKTLNGVPIVQPDVEREPVKPPKLLDDWDRSLIDLVRRTEENRT